MKFSDFGESRRIPGLPEMRERNFLNFSSGYWALDSKDDVPETASPFFIDFEVSRDDKLIRAPGTEQIEALSEVPDRMFIHGSLDYTAELLFIAPPFLGVKDESTTVFTDLGLKGAWFAGTNFGGTYIFTDGWNVYARQPESVSITEIPEAPIARTYATFAGRVVAGYALIDGQNESVGQVWSAANSNYLDWTGIGSGFELLISNDLVGEKIVKNLPMGLNLMAVMMRNSIWIGRPTGLRDRPIDFLPRVEGLGAVNDRVCQATPVGVFFLSDSGVYSFDGNSTQPVSLQIDPDILPLNYSQIERYHATYDPTRQRYTLYTPTDTWVYDIKYQRWYRRSLTADDAVVFPRQADFIAWGELIGDWGDQADFRWMDYAGVTEGSSDVLMLKGSRLDIEDDASEQYFGVDFDPIYRFALRREPLTNWLVSTKWLFIDYEANAASSFDIYLPDLDGVYIESLTDQMFGIATSIRLKQLTMQHTGRGMGMELHLRSGKPRISAVQLQGHERGPRLYGLQDTAIFEENEVMLVFDMPFYDSGEIL